MKDGILVIETLKELIKAKGLTYALLAEKMDLSEASIKRIFSNKTFTLERVEAICHQLEISLFDVFDIASHTYGDSIYEYSLEQELFFVKNPNYLAFFDFLLNGKSISSIKARFQLTQKEANAYLQKLESLDLITLTLDQKISLNCSKNIKWRDEGPLKKEFFNRAKFEFLNSKFQKSDEFLKFAILSLGPENRLKLEKETRELLRKYEKSAQLEKKLGIPTQSVGILYASREWNFSVLEYL